MEHALEKAQCLPRRKFKDAAEFADYFKQEETLIFDGVEQRVQRPNDDEAPYTGLREKVPYAESGDDEHPARRILYLSECWVGKTHDHRMFEIEFPPEKNWFADFRVRVDSSVF
ncbi:MAG: hypothetical protein U0X75_02615 [Acidobacteriota bacterium]